MTPITSAIRRQMTDEGARVTADRDEFCAVCDAVDSIHARKLRALDASTRRVDELCRENERLRELVRDMWEGYNDPRCEDCPLKDKPACADCPICAREAAVIDRMRELGIEVDG